MAEGYRQYYVAVSDQRMKLPTLADLLNALLVSGPIGILISCSSRDSLDAVAAGIANSVPDADFTILHASLKSEEINSLLSSMSIRRGPLEAGNDSSARPKSDDSEQSEGAARNRLQEALEGGSNDPSDPTYTPLEPKADFQSQPAGGGDVPNAKIVIMTDALLKQIQSSSFPADLSLLVNFDLPLQKDYYTRQIDLVSTRRREKSKATGILIHFVVAGQIADFRTLESKSPGPIDVMPVHVEDVFREVSM